MKGVLEMTVNKKLNYAGCWKMVNRIEDGADAQEIRRRCNIAERWLTANEVIDKEQFNELMMAVSFIHRESYRYERG